MEVVVVFPFVPVTPMVKIERCLFLTSHKSLPVFLNSSPTAEPQMLGLKAIASQDSISSLLLNPRSMERLSFSILIRDSEGEKSASLSEIGKSSISLFSFYTQSNNCRFHYFTYFNLELSNNQLNHYKNLNINYFTSN